MPWQDVVSVCLSVTRRYSVDTAEHILNFFYRQIAHHSSFFPYQTLWQYSDRDPITGASNARGYEEIAIFDQYLALSPK